MVKVQNLNGTANRVPKGYASWLKYWEKQTNSIAIGCQHVGCKGLHVVGAHVKRVGGNNNKWYIIPLCQECNKRTDEFDVLGTLVPVNP